MWAILMLLSLQLNLGDLRMEEFFHYEKGDRRMKKVLILGAAGRDFHNFNTYFRDNSDYRVVAFTATQIPDIEGRKYPAALAGKLYPKGIPIEAEAELDDLIAAHKVDDVHLAYSDLPHAYAMDKAPQVLAAGANFVL